MYLLVVVANRHTCSLIDGYVLGTLLSEVVSACVAYGADDVSVEFFHLESFFQFLEGCKQYLLHNVFGILALPDSNVGKTK